MHILRLVAARLAATTRTLELSALRLDERTRMRVRNAGRESEMLLGETSLARALQQNRVFAFGRALSKLIEREHFAARLRYADARRLRHAKSGDLQTRCLATKRVSRLVPLASAPPPCARRP